MDAEKILHIGRYHVLRKLGRGGMGVVFLARDPFIDRLVAIKTSTAPPPEDEEKLKEFKNNFFNEARAAGRLSHRNIVSVYDASVDDYFSYLVMEYVDGPTLSQQCRDEGPLPINKAVNITFQCAKALDYAHQNQVVHRDVKSSNILLNKDGRPKISDFGIAAVRGGAGPGADAGYTGSGHYMAPEQIAGRASSPQSDIFSLGVVAYELLTGRRPFEADSDVTLMYKIANEDPESIKRRRPEAPESLDRIVLKCLRKDPAARYHTGGRLAQELIAAFAHLKNVSAEVSQDDKLQMLKKIAFFKTFSTSELAEVIDKAEWVRHEAASTIISEGEIDDAFYILASGEVVVRKRAKWLAKLGPGDCFGEMAYLGKTRRTASILAATDAILMKLNAAVIDSASLATQLRFYRVFSKTLIERLARTSDLLSRQDT